MVRASIVLIVFVATTVLVLGVIHPSTVRSASGSVVPAAPTTTSRPTHPATTTTTIPPSTVHVLVANASGVTGAAATVSNRLQVGGWNLLPPVNASAKVTTSSVYFVAGQQQAADAVAAALHLPASVVVPYTTAAPITTIGTAEVAVVVGPDLVAPSTSTTPTTAARTPTTVARTTTSSTVN